MSDRPPEEFPDSKSVIAKLCTEPLQAFLHCGCHSRDDRLPRRLRPALPPAAPIDSLAHHLTSEVSLYGE
eukprot:2487884-Rhodomonas_salina.1